MTIARSTPITSADNPQFKYLKKIASSPRDRREAGKTLLDGIHLLTALADAGAALELLVLRVGAEQEHEVTQCLLRFPNTPIISLPPKLLAALSPVETPVGILGLMAIPQAQEKHCQFGVLLENIQDPGNLGSVLRSAAAAGVEAVYLSLGCAEAWSPKALRAGMGAQFALAIHEQHDLSVAAQNFDVVVATTLAGEQSLFELNLAGSIAFIFGNEGAGLSDALMKRATHLTKIPMPGKIESLNVAAAVAICLFERVRQTINRTAFL